MVHATMTMRHSVTLGRPQKMTGKTAEIENVRILREHPCSRCLAQKGSDFYFFHKSIAS